MPQYLSRSSVRLLEASMDSLAIALTALALPKRHQLRSEEAKNAAVIGMAGTSAEQALAAILIQVMGTRQRLLRAPNTRRLAPYLMK